MQKALMTVLMIAGLAACGGQGGKAKLVSACMEDGSATQEQCDCFATQAEETLSPELFGKFVSALEAGEDGGQEMMADLEQDEGMQLMGFMFSVGTTCGMELS
ncbi:MAG: hypothetical protein AAGJ84_11215 [Pseudomonadota bacterium]